MTDSRLVYLGPRLDTRSDFARLNGLGGALLFCS